MHKKFSLYLQHLLRIHRTEYQCFLASIQYCHATWCYVLLYWLFSSPQWGRTNFTFRMIKTLFMEKHKTTFRHQIKQMNRIQHHLPSPSGFAAHKCLVWWQEPYKSVQPWQLIRLVWSRSKLIKYWWICCFWTAVFSSGILSDALFIALFTSAASFLQCWRANSRRPRLGFLLNKSQSPSWWWYFHPGE